MKNIFIIIPGYREDLKSIGYKEIRKTALSSGYEVILFQPKWNYQTINNWVFDLSSKLKNLDRYSSITLLGFSIGAMIALLYASKEDSVKINKLILCSLSPYFNEDLKSIPETAFKVLGTRRMNAFKKTILPKKVMSEIIYTVGEKEWDVTINRVVQAFKKIRSDKKNIIRIKDTGHNISEENYIKEIIKEIKKPYINRGFNS